jgi:hypothetical protein
LPISPHIPALKDVPLTLAGIELSKVGLHLYHKNLFGDPGVPVNKKGLG